MDPIFRWLESTALSTWMRESTSILAFPGFLVAHAIGMALAVGVNAGIALGLLGVAPGLPTRDMRAFAGVMWFGFALNLASGALLFLAYPTKALTNPVFYLKLFLIVVAMRLFVAIDRRARGVYPSGEDSKTQRKLAVASLACWGGAVTAGRLLAYTFRRMNVDW
jgi:hypothetical protein